MATLLKNLLLHGGGTPAPNPIGLKINLWCNEFISLEQLWNTSGSSPYLGDNNDYIYTAKKDANSVAYGFINLPPINGTYIITGCVLHLECYKTASAVRVLIWWSGNGSTGFGLLGTLTPPNSYGYITLDVFSLSYNKTTIDNSWLMLEKHGTSGTCYIRRAYLEVTYTII